MRIYCHCTGRSAPSIDYEDSANRQEDMEAPPSAHHFASNTSSSVRDGQRGDCTREGHCVPAGILAGAHPAATGGGRLLWRGDLGPEAAAESGRREAGRGQPRHGRPARRLDERRQLCSHSLQVCAHPACRKAGSFHDKTTAAVPVVTCFSSQVSKKICILVALGSTVPA